MSKTDELQYAKDVLWVYSNLGSTEEKLWKQEGTTANKMILFNWIGTPEGRDALLKTILPKAQDALVKARANRDPDSIVEKETKSIAQLREFVKDVVSDALTEAAKKENLKEAQESWERRQ